MLSQILGKVSVKWPRKTVKKKNIEKKYQKNEIVNNLWRIQRPKRSILSIFEASFQQ